MTIFFCFAQTACAGGVRAQQAERISSLASYVTELEAKVTALTEQSLEREHQSCAEKKASSGPQPSKRPRRSAKSSASSAPEDLPVVRLSPHGTEAAGASLAEATGPDPVVEPSSEEDPSAGQVRQVLQVHGAAEGRVFSRTVSAAEQEEPSAL